MNTDKPRLIPVMAGKTCAGHLVSLGAYGVEAFDRDDKSLGVFTDPIAAATAVERAANVTSRRR
jgi:hypothetical protein